MSNLNTNYNPIYVRFLPTGDLVAAEPQPEGDVLGPQSPVRRQPLQSLSLDQISLNDREVSLSNSVEDISLYLASSPKRRKTDEKENAQTSSRSQPAEEGKDFTELHDHDLDKIFALLAGQGSKAFGLTCKRLLGRYEMLKAPLYKALPNTLYRYLKDELTDYRQKLIAFESGVDPGNGVYIPYPSNTFAVPSFQEFLDVFEYDYFGTEKFPELDFGTGPDASVRGESIKAFAFVEHMMWVFSLVGCDESDRESVIKAVRNLDVTSRKFKDEMAPELDSHNFVPYKMNRIVRLYIEYYMCFTYLKAEASMNPPSAEIDINQDADVGYLYAFPPLIRHLTNLKSLVVDGLGIQLVPDELFGLTNLEELNLNNNDFTEIPDSLRNLINLTHLALAGNQLKKFPEGLSRLHQLKALYINNNELDSRPNFDIRLLSNLETLCLGANRGLKGVFELQEIMALTRLGELDINDKAIMRAFNPNGDLSSDSENDDLSDSSDFEQ